MTVWMLPYAINLAIATLLCLSLLTFSSASANRITLRPDTARGEAERKTSFIKRDPLQGKLAIVKRSNGSKRDSKSVWTRCAECFSPSIQDQEPIPDGTEMIRNRAKLSGDQRTERKPAIRPRRDSRLCTYVAHDDSRSSNNARTHPNFSRRVTFSEDNKGKEGDPGVSVGRNVGRRKAKDRHQRCAGCA